MAGKAFPRALLGCSGHCHVRRFLGECFLRCKPSDASRGQTARLPSSPLTPRVIVRLRRPVAEALACLTPNVSPSIVVVVPGAFSSPRRTRGPVSPRHEPHPALHLRGGLCAVVFASVGERALEHHSAATSRPIRHQLRFGIRQVRWPRRWQPVATVGMRHGRRQRRWRTQVLERLLGHLRRWRYRLASLTIHLH